MQILRLALFALAICIAFPAVSQDVQAGRKKSGVCVGCHGIKGRSSNLSYPILDGQNAGYLYRQMENYQHKHRGDLSMTLIMPILSRDDMLSLAAFYAAQTPAVTKFKADPERVARGRAKSKELQCPMCHGRNLSGQQEIPRLTGQQYDYVVKQLRDFRGGLREHATGEVADAIKALSDMDLENFGHYIAAMR